MYIHKLIVFLALLGFSSSVFPKTIQTTSPDRQLTVAVTIDENVSYSVIYKNQLILKQNHIDITLADGKSLSGDLRMRSVKNRVINKTINPVIATKNEEIEANPRSRSAKLRVAEKMS